MNTFRVSGAALLVTLIAATALGQTVTITGIVCSPAGKPVPGVKVTAFSSGVDFPAKALTAKDGAYLIEITKGTQIDSMLFERDRLLPSIVLVSLAGHWDNVINTVVASEGAPAYAEAFQAFDHLANYARQTKSEAVGKLVKFYAPQVAIATQHVSRIATQHDENLELQNLAHRGKWLQSYYTAIGDRPKAYIYVYPWVKMQEVEFKQEIDSPAHEGGRPPR